MLLAGINCPVATSLGRVFDAAAAILGLVDHASYEGEGPIRLEGRGIQAFRGPGDLGAHGVRDPRALVPVIDGASDGRIFQLDPRPLLSALLGGAGDDIPRLSLLFHEAIALASVEGAVLMRRHTGISRLTLSGGVFQNLLLREIMVPHLIKEGFEVFLNVRAPAGDGGLAVGQAWFES